MRTCSCVRANDAKIVRSRDAQCNTKKLPKCMHTDTTSQEYLIKLPIGDSDLSFVFSFELKFK